MGTFRPIRLPPADIALHELPTRSCELNVLRVHHVAIPAMKFRLSRKHRFSHPDAAVGLLYAGEDLETCLWECYGDSILEPVSEISKADWSARRLTRIVSSLPVKICDLAELATRRKLRMDLSALKNPDLAIPQAWGHAIQNHPDAADALRYPSRFTGKPCLALFDRPGLAGRCEETPLGALHELEEAAGFLETNSIALV